MLTLERDVEWMLREARGLDAGDDAADIPRLAKALIARITHWTGTPLRQPPVAVSLECGVEEGGR